MPALTLTPTTDTIWGWLILAILAVIVTAGALCLWDVIVKHIEARRAWDAEFDAAMRGDVTLTTLDDETLDDWLTVTKVVESARREIERQQAEDNRRAAQVYE